MRALLVLSALLSCISLPGCGRHIPVGGRGPVHALVFSGNGAFVTAITKETQEGARLSVVDVQTGKATYRAEDMVVRLHTSIGGREIHVPYVTAEGQIGLLEPQTGVRRETSLRLPHGVVPLSIALSGGQVIVTGYRENGARVWVASAGIGAGTWDVIGVPGLGFPARVTVAGEGMRLFFGHDLATLRGPREYAPNEIRTYCSKGAMAPDGGQVALGDSDGQLTLWRERGVVRRRANPESILEAVAVCPDAAVTSHKDGTLRFWDTKTGELIGEKDVMEPATALACSASGTLAIGFVSPEVMLLQMGEILSDQRNSRPAHDSPSR